MKVELYYQKCKDNTSLYYHWKKLQNITEVEIIKKCGITPLYEGDIVHITNQLAAYMAYFAKKPIIITVHDIAHLELEEFRNMRLVYRAILTGLNRANKLIAISKTTRDKLKEVLGVDPKKVEVVYNGIEDEFYKGP